MGDRTADTLRELARRVGAARGWVVRAADVHAVLDAIGFEGERLCVLGGEPIACAPVRVLAREAHAEDRLLACDISLATSAHCAPVQQGADLCVEALDLTLGEGCGLVAFAAADGIEVDVSALEPAGDDELEALACELATVDERMRTWSDAAQVVASYLSCHPRVRSVAYPGLKSDASFSIAATTLHHGFGAYVDYCLAGEGAWRRICCRNADARKIISTQLMDGAGAFSGL